MRRKVFPGPLISRTCSARIAGHTDSYGADKSDICLVRLTADTCDLDIPLPSGAHVYVRCSTRGIFSVQMSIEERSASVNWQNC